VARGPEARHERGADVAGDTGHQETHRPSLPVGRRGKTPRVRGRQVAGSAFFITLEGICGIDENSVRFANTGLAAPRESGFA
jgi:hypothetical protein